jgi:hypothetical protein
VTGQTFYRKGDEDMFGGINAVAIESRIIDTNRDWIVDCSR